MRARAAFTLVAEIFNTVHRSALPMTLSGLPDRKSTCDSKVPSEVCFELNTLKQLRSGGICGASRRREAKVVEPEVFLMTLGGKSLIGLLPLIQFGPAEET